MPRNPGNRHRDIKIYPDANLKFVRMKFTENKKINLKVCAPLPRRGPVQVCADFANFRIAVDASAIIFRFSYFM